MLFYISLIQLHVYQLMHFSTRTEIHLANQLMEFGFRSCIPRVKLTFFTKSVENVSRLSLHVGRMEDTKYLVWCRVKAFRGTVS